MSDDIIKHIMAQFDFDTDKFAAIWQSGQEKLEAIAANLALYEQGCKSAVEKLDASCSPSLEHLADACDAFAAKLAQQAADAASALPSGFMEDLNQKIAELPAPQDAAAGSASGRESWRDFLVHLGAELNKAFTVPDAQAAAGIPAQFMKLAALAAALEAGRQKLSFGPEAAGEKAISELRHLEKGGAGHAEDAFFKTAAPALSAGAKLPGEPLKTGVAAAPPSAAGSAIPRLFREAADSALPGAESGSSASPFPFKNKLLGKFKTWSNGGAHPPTIAAAVESLTPPANAREPQDAPLSGFGPDSGFADRLAQGLFALADTFTGVDKLEFAELPRVADVPALAQPQPAPPAALNVSGSSEIHPQMSVSDIKLASPKMETMDQKAFERHLDKAMAELARDVESGMLTC